MSTEAWLNVTFFSLVHRTREWNPHQVKQSQIATEESLEVRYALKQNKQKKLGMFSRFLYQILRIAGKIPFHPILYLFTIMGIRWEKNKDTWATPVFSRACLYLFSKQTKWNTIIGASTHNDWQPVTPPSFGNSITQKKPQRNAQRGDVVVHTCKLNFTHDAKKTTSGTNTRCAVVTSDNWMFADCKRLNSCNKV